MFSRKKIIVALSKKRIKALSIDPKNSSEVIIDSQWTPETLTIQLKKIMETTGENSFVFLFHDDLCYPAVIDVTDDEKNDSQKILIKAQEKIPEKIEETLWTFNEIFSYIDDHSKKISFIQVLTLSANFTAVIQQALKTLSLNIEVATTPSMLLADLLKTEKEPQIIICDYDGILLLLVYKGLVFSALTFPPKTMIGAEQINEFSTYSSEFLQIEPKTVILINNLETIDQQSLTTEKYQLKSMSLSIESQFASVIGSSNSQLTALKISSGTEGKKINKKTIALLIFFFSLF